MHSELGAGVQGGLQGISTANDAMKTSADVELKSAQTAVAKAEEVLKKNLIPGSEAISTLAGALADIVKASDTTIRGKGEQAIGALGDWADVFIMKAKGLGISAKRLLEATAKEFNGLTVEELGKALDLQPDLRYKRK